MNTTQNSDVKTYTEGPILTSILHMGLPSMFGFLSQNIYALVDTYWVSRLPQGESAVAAITFFSTLLWLFFSFNSLVGPGSVAVISRRFGERNIPETEKTIRETLVLKLLFGFTFGALGFFTIEPMLRILGATGEVLSLGVMYGEITFVGMGIGYAMYTIFTAMRSIANPKLAMILMIGSNLLNLALDPVFIFGYLGMPAMGIRGAALASLISYGLTLGVGLILFSSSWVNVQIKFKGGIPISASSMWKLIRIGIPMWLGGLSFSGARLIITPLVATFGTSVVAAYGVGNQISSFGIMVLVGMGLGLSSLIGHNVGEGKIDRARQTGNHAIVFGVAIMVLLSCITALFPEAIMGIFFQNPETIAIGATMLRILAFGWPFLGLFLMVEEIHAGVGMNMPGMVFNIIHSWGLEIVPILILTQIYGLGELAIWWTMAGSIVISSIAFYAYYRQGKWLHAKV